MYIPAKIHINHQMKSDGQRKVDQLSSNKVFRINLKTGKNTPSDVYKFRPR
jgi:hypothetical protein